MTSETQPPPGFDPYQVFPGTTWETVKWKLSNATSVLFPKELFPWKKWPGAPNFLLERDVWACQDGWWAYFKFSEYALLNFFWTSFFPSPVELERKTLLGSYKCGFYLPIKIKSPMELLVGEEGVEILAKIARPITTALFWWWAAETAWSAFDTAQTIVYKEQFCDDLRNVFVADGAGTTFAIDVGGTPVGPWHPITDPEGLCGVACTGIFIPAGDFRVRFEAHFLSAAGTTIYDAKVWLELPTGDKVEKSFDNNKVNEGKSQFISLTGHSAVGWSVIPMFAAKRTGGGPFSARCEGSAFSVAWDPD